MASPVISRSPSTSAIFAPGAHRRSHPNLQHLGTLSLAPLTPKYPIDPADYDAYYDPQTSELHTSTSLSQIAALPSPGGILAKSPVRSRETSRSRTRLAKKKIRSHVNILEPERDESLHRSRTEPDGEDGDTDVVDRKPIPRTSKSQPALAKLQIHTHTADPSWLVQTGLSLTESSRETKGQSWLSKRDSSTSLSNTPTASGETYFDFKRRPLPSTRSGRATPSAARSRVGSRIGSRNASRNRLDSGLRMTSAGSTGSLGDVARVPGVNATFATAPDVDEQIPEEDDEADVQPDWADARTQAEVAAQLQEELADEFGFDDDYGDPYGMLDFEGQGYDDGDTDEDEEEVRRAMTSWKVGLGSGWMDGAIEALTLVEEGRIRGAQRGVRIDVESGNDYGGGIRGADGDAEEDENEQAVERPPERVRGVWDDLAWFGRLVRRSVIS